MNLTHDELNRLIASLPQDIQDAFFSDENSQSILDIGEKHGFMKDNVGDLGDEISNVMFGITPISDFVKNLADRLGVDNEKVKAIAEDINLKIFLPIRESLIKVHGSLLVAPQEKPAAMSPSLALKPPTPPAAVSPISPKISMPSATKLGGLEEFTRGQAALLAPEETNIPATESEYINCTSCNAEIELPANFCSMCGASLPSTATGGGRSSGRMSSEITNLIKLASFGDVSDKLQAIARFKNEHSRMLLEFMLGSVGIEEPITEAGKLLGHIKAVPVVLDSGVLPDVLQQLRLLSEKGSRLVAWYASLALVELGDTSEETAILLLANSHVLLSVVDGDDMRMHKYVFQFHTIRSMSRFRDNPAVVEEIKGALQGAPLNVDLWEKDDGLRSCLLCAAGALGSPELLPIITFWGENKAQTDAGKAARVALQHFGKESFDDIASQAGITL